MAYKGLFEDDMFPCNSMLDEEYVLLTKLSDKRGVQVYKGKVVESKKLVAVKVYDGSLYDGALNEGYARIVLGNVPGVPQCIGTFKHAFRNEFWFITPFFDHGSLWDILDERKIPFQEHEIGYMCGKILFTLCKLHDTGLIHRDIKCSNILRHGDEVYLNDFELTCKSQNGSIKSQNRVGSLHFLAPELLYPENDTLIYTQWSDIWALGASIIEMYTLNPPMFRRNESELLTQVEPYIPILPNCSEYLQSFIDSCMAKNPVNRKSARELIQHPFIKQHMYTKEESLSRIEETHLKKHQLIKSISCYTGGSYDIQPFRPSLEILNQNAKRALVGKHNIEKVHAPVLCIKKIHQQSNARCSNANVHLAHVIDRHFSTVQDDIQNRNLYFSNTLELHECPFSSQEEFIALEALIVSHCQQVIGKVNKLE